MKIDRQELLKALSALRPGLAKKDIVEQATHFVFIKDKIITYNDQICIMYPFDTGFECSVKADEFYKILSSMTDAEVELISEENKLILNSGSVKSGFTASTDRYVIELVEQMDIPGEWIRLPGDFIEGLSFCIFSVSKDVSRRILSCINVSGDQIVSSDDNRISQYTMASPVEDSLLIQGSAVLELIKFEIKEYARGQSWIYFKTEDGVVFASRVIEGEYPDASEFFDFEFTRFRLPDNLKQAVEMVSIFAEGDFDIDKKIEVIVKDGKIKCKGEKEIGWAETEADIKLKSEEAIKFAINPIFFSQILDHTTTICCGKDRAMFTTKNFKHLLSLF